MIATDPASFRRQQGATLVVGMILLMVITLTVGSAFMMGNTNQKAVGNFQFRNEAIAAVNKAVEQVLSSPFTTSPTAEEINVDINNDGTIDYIVQIAAPDCVRALEVGASGAAGFGSSSELQMPTDPSSYQTTWDIAATVTDAATGASITVHQGILVQLNQTQYTAVCT